MLEYAMKVVERIFEHRILQHIEVDDMQFGFRKGKGTTDAIFIVQHLLVTGFKQPVQINDFITLYMLPFIPLHFLCTHF